jgi:hypothetical protein
MRSHFEKLHKHKPGGIFCNTCAKNIAQIGQNEQLQQHMESAKHIEAEARVGKAFRYCATCGAVNPVSSHNPRHKVVEEKYEKVQEGSISTVDHGTKDRFAQSIISYSYWNKRRQMSIGVWCNEHFEKIFGFDYRSVPVPVTVGEQRAECRVCKSTNAIWEKAAVRPGKIITVDEQDYRKFVVGYVVQQHKMREEVSPAEYATLSEEQQDMYFWNNASKTFLLTVSKAKEAAAKDFLVNGAKPGPSYDTTDGQAAQRLDTSVLE